MPSSPNDGTISSCRHVEVQADGRALAARRCPIAGRRRDDRDRRSGLDRLDQLLRIGRLLVTIVDRGVGQVRWHGRRRVVERDVLEADLAAHRRAVHRDRIGRIDDLGVHLEVLEDPVEQRQRALDLDLDPEQLTEREEEPALERGEGDDRAGRRRVGAAVGGQRPGQPVHERRHDAEDRADDHEEPAPDHRLADLESGQRLVLPPELVDRGLLLTERLRQQDPGDAQGLLGRGAHLGQRLLGLGRHLAADLPDPIGQVQEDRREAEGQEGEPPVEDEHRDHRRDRDGEVAGDRAGRVGHDRLDATDVVGQAALDLARSRLGEEAERHPLEVGVQGAAQVLHDALADDVVEVALPDADEAR